MKTQESDRCLLHGFPLIAPGFGTDAYQQVQAALDEAETTMRAMWEESRQVSAAVNRSKRHTPKGISARHALTEFMARQGQNEALRKRLRRTLELSLVEHHLAAATDRFNADGLRLRAHKLRWESNTLDGETQQERNCLHEVCAHWQEKAVEDCPADFTSEMKQAVAGRVMSYLYNVCDNSKAYSLLRCLAIEEQRTERARRIEREQEEARAQGERFRELQPFAGFAIRPKEAWLGNKLLGKHNTWACDGTVGFVIPDKPSKTIEKLIEKAGYDRFHPARWADALRHIEGAEKVSATLLGWRNAVNGFTYSPKPTAYFETPMGYFAVDCYRLALVQAATHYDASAYAVVSYERGEHTYTNSMFLFYRAEVLVGLLMPLSQPEPIAPPE